jgi:hypothetical protein
VLLDQQDKTRARCAAACQCFIVTTEGWAHFAARAEPEVIFAKSLKLTELVETFRQRQRAVERCAPIQRGRVVLLRCGALRSLQDSQQDSQQHRPCAPSSKVASAMSCVR